MRRFRLTLSFFYLTLLIFTTHGNNGDADLHSLLLKIKTPQQLLFPYFPKRYNVALELSGNIADEMNSTIAKMGLKTPNYFEEFDGEVFLLLLSDTDFPANTRELLTGILNPAELIDITLEFLLKYRSSDFLKELKQNTTVSKELTFHSDQPVWRFTLIPKGKQFGYSFADKGAFVQETWFTEMDLIVDTSGFVVYEINARRIHRHFSSLESAAETKEEEITYRFAYMVEEEVFLPSRLDILLDRSEILTIEARYRKGQKREFVFDSKEICASKGDEKRCLRVKYGDYKFSTSGTRKKSPDNKRYTRDLSRASQLSSRATELLRSGNIASSMRVLKTLVERFPDTPQAVEARRILMSLPAGVY